MFVRFAATAPQARSSNEIQAQESFAEDLYSHENTQEIQSCFREAHVKLAEMTAPTLSDGERYLFARCKDILHGAADNRIPRKTREMKRQLQILKKIGELIKDGRPIPQELTSFYRKNHKDIEKNIKAYVATKSKSYAKKISFSSDPKKGIEQICKKASLALFWGVYSV